MVGSVNVFCRSFLEGNFSSSNFSVVGGVGGQASSGNGMSGGAGYWEIGQIISGAYSILSHK